MKQDDEIKSLREKIEAADRRSAENRDAIQNGNHHQSYYRPRQHQLPPPPSSSSRRRSGDRGYRDYDPHYDDDDDGGYDDVVADTFHRSGAQVQRAFDEGYERWGRRFAAGDVVTENKLQAQIIALQQTVIAVLQDALRDGRRLTRADMARLVAASDAAREGSLDALDAQRRRLMAIEAAPPRRPSPPASGSFSYSLRSRSYSPPPPPQSRRGRTTTLPASSEDSVPERGRRAGSEWGLRVDKEREIAERDLEKERLRLLDRDRDRDQDRDRARHQELLLLPPAPPPAPAPAPASVVTDEPLYCPYALLLQNTPHKPLVAAFAPGRGDRRCPACRARIPGAGPEDFWAITKREAHLVDVDVEDPRNDRHRHNHRRRSINGGGVETTTTTTTQREVVREREFHFGQRFLVKCHTAAAAAADGGNGGEAQFACVLCTRHRAADAICRTVDSLVKHVALAHDVRELEGEVDMFSEKPVPAPAPAPSPPKTRYNDDYDGVRAHVFTAPPAPSPPPAVPDPPSSAAAVASSAGGRDIERERQREVEELASLRARERERDREWEREKEREREWERERERERERDREREREREREMNRRIPLPAKYR